MSQSPTATRYRAVFTKLRDLLLTEMKPAKENGWLVKVDECIVGLHAEDSAFKATGVYLVPRSSRATEPETNMWEHAVHVRCIISRMSLNTDRGQTDPPTFDVTDIATAIMDLVQANRYLDLGGGEKGLILNADDVEQVPFEFAVHPTKGPLYRAEVNLRVEVESPTP